MAAFSSYSKTSLVGAGLLALMYSFLIVRTFSLPQHTPAIMTERYNVQTESPVNKAQPELPRGSVLSSPGGYWSSYAVRNTVIALEERAEVRLDDSSSDIIQLTLIQGAAIIDDSAIVRVRDGSVSITEPTLVRLFSAEKKLDVIPLGSQAEAVSFNIETGASIPLVANLATSNLAPFVEWSTRGR